MKPFLFFLSALLMSTLLSAQEAHTHADGTTHAAHGDEAAPSAARPGADHFTAYGESDKYELTLYYPELVAGQEAHLTLFVADYKSNRPIDKAELKISLLEDPQTAFEARLLSPGVYELHGTFSENKTYTLNVQVSHPNGADLIGIKDVAVGQKLVAAATVASPHTHSHGWMWFLGGLALGGEEMLHQALFMVLQRRQPIPFHRDPRIQGRQAIGNFLLLCFRGNSQRKFFDNRKSQRQDCRFDCVFSD